MHPERGPRALKILGHQTLAGPSQLPVPSAICARWHAPWLPGTAVATWVVTGTNRGIGLEFARQLSARGETVIATARQPKKARDLARLDGVRIEELDVASQESI